MLRRSRLPKVAPEITVRGDDRIIVTFAATEVTEAFRIEMREPAALDFIQALAEALITIEARRPRAAGASVCERIGGLIDTLATGEHRN